MGRYDHKGVCVFVSLNHIAPFGQQEAAAAAGEAATGSAGAPSAEPEVETAEPGSATGEAGAEELEPEDVHAKWTQSDMDEWRRDAKTWQGFNRSEWQEWWEKDWVDEEEGDSTPPNSTMSVCNVKCLIHGVL